MGFKYRPELSLEYKTPVLTTALHCMQFMAAAYVHYTECNRIRYTTLKICDQTKSNITTQFLTEHLLTLQIFVQVFSMAATGYAADIQTIF
jgi:hypothetical protein